MDTINENQGKLNQLTKNTDYALRIATVTACQTAIHNIKLHKDDIKPIPKFKLHLNEHIQLGTLSNANQSRGIVLGTLVPEQQIVSIPTRATTFEDENDVISSLRNERQGSSSQLGSPVAKENYVISSLRSVRRVNSSQTGSPVARELSSGFLLVKGSPRISSTTPRTPSQTPLSPRFSDSFRSPHLEKNEIGTIRIPKGKKRSSITSSCVLNKGKVVLCDEANERLLYLAITDKFEGFTELNRIHVPGHPFNMVHYKIKRKIMIAVTMLESNVIKRFIVTDAGALKDTRSDIPTKPECRGIAYIDGKLIYTAKQYIVIINEQNGQEIETITYKFRLPMAVIADPLKGFYYVIFTDIKEINKGFILKKHISPERSTESRLSYQCISQPVSITLHSDGYLYICDVDPSSIHEVGTDGKYNRCINQSKSNTVWLHINSLKWSHQYLVTERSSDTIQIYSIGPEED